MQARQWLLAQAARGLQRTSRAIALAIEFGHSDLVADTKLHLIRTVSRKQSWRAGAGESHQQVAAVCYQVRKGKIEFLLVRTRKGRWTFPKGGVVHGLTHAQSAALEAFEEAGVHGRIEESSFVTYVLRKRGNSPQATTRAHLCEVLRLEAPQEANRMPTWFFPEAAQSSLRAQRTSPDGGELARVVQRAVGRIQRLLASAASRTDSLQRVHFEAAGAGLTARSVLVAYFRSDRQKLLHAPLLEFDEGSRKVVRIESAARRQQSTD